MLRRKTKRATPPESPTDYPVHTFIKTEKGYFYITAPTKRFRIVTERCLNSWAPPRVVETTEAAVGRYRIASKLKFRNGSLIHNLSDGKIYLIVDGKRCQIIDPDVLERIGAVYDDAVTVSQDEVNLHPEGETLT
jgi:hypothetical protein